MRSPSVADELTFDRILESLSTDDRASVERVITSRTETYRYGCPCGEGTIGHSDEALAAARREGYELGVTAGRSDRDTAA